MTRRKTWVNGSFVPMQVARSTLRGPYGRRARPSSQLDFLFFFKQKTAYEIPLCDWSSTCALPIFGVDPETFTVTVDGEVWEPEPVRELPMARSEERRVGKEGIAGCRSRGWRY